MTKVRGDIEGFMQKKWEKKPVRKKDKMLIVGIVAVFFVVGFLAVQAVSDDDSVEIERMKGDQVKKEVQTIMPTERVNASSLLLIGEVFSNEVAQIYPRREGIIKDLYVDIGDEVQAGEVIGTLFPRGVEGQSDAIIYEAERKRDLADDIVDARDDLADAVEDAADERDLSDEEEELIDEEQDFLEESAWVNRETAQVALDKEIVIQGHTKLISPFSGVIAKRYVGVGEGVAPSKAVFSLVDVPTSLSRKAKTEIKFGLPENLGDVVEVGDEITFFVGDDDVNPRAAVVTRISPQVDEMTHHYTVQARVPDDIKLSHHTSVRIRLETSLERVFSVPSSSIKRVQDENFIWLMKRDADTAVKLHVRVIADDGEFAEIVGDIDESTRIVKRVTESITNDARVMPAPSMGFEEEKAEEIIEVDTMEEGSVEDQGEDMMTNGK